MAYTQTALPNLAATQTSWTLTGGQNVIVDVRQITPDAGIDVDTSTAHLVIQVTSWEANANGTPVLDSAGRKLGPPKKSISIMTSSLAEGSITLAAELATITQDALDRISQWLAIYPAMQTLMTNSQSAPSV